MSSAAPPATIRSRDLLARYLGPQWRRAALLAVLLLGGIGLELANPQILRVFIDQATAGADLAAFSWDWQSPRSSSRWLRTTWRRTSA
jgi:hypothetical protein